jgi:BTB/POZ domain
MTWTITCRDKVFVIDLETHQIHLSPVLESIISEESVGSVDLDRDPVLFDLLLQYVKTGIMPEEGYTDQFFSEADYWGIAPLNPHLTQHVQAEFNIEEFCYDASVFIERLLNTNHFNMEKKQPVTSYVIPCRSYQQNDRWSDCVDAYKYVVGHPNLFRSTAFTHFGVDINFDLFSSMIEFNDLSQSTFTEAREVVYNVANWDHFGSYERDGIQRFGVVSKKCPSSSVATCVLTKNSMNEYDEKILVYNDTSISISADDVEVTAEMLTNGRLVPLAIVVCWLRDITTKEQWEADITA